MDPRSNRNIITGPQQARFAQRIYLDLKGLGWVNIKLEAHYGAHVSTPCHRLSLCLSSYVPFNSSLNEDNHTLLPLETTTRR
jgi:hypothetical protein